MAYLREWTLSEHRDGGYRGRGIGLAKIHLLAVPKQDHLPLLRPLRPTGLAFRVLSQVVLAVAARQATPVPTARRHVAYAYPCVDAEVSLGGGMPLFTYDGGSS